VTTTTQQWAPFTDTSRRPPRRRRGTVAVGLLLAVLGAAVAYWAASRGEPATRVVVLAAAEQRGHILTAADLATVSVTVSGGQPRLASPELARAALLGRALLLNLPAGTLLTPEMVGDAAPPAGSVALGVKVSPDALPSRTLRPGETVQVLGFDGASGQAVVLSRQASVTSVDPDTAAGNGAMVVYLTVPVTDAAAVATAAASAQGVRLLGPAGAGS